MIFSDLKKCFSTSFFQNELLGNLPAYSDWVVFLNVLKEYL
jgi:hypothetical protein